MVFTVAFKCLNLLFSEGLVCAGFDRSLWVCLLDPAPLLVELVSLLEGVLDLGLELFVQLLDAEAGFALEEFEEFWFEDVGEACVCVDGHVVEADPSALDDEACEVDLLFLPACDLHFFEGPEVVSAVEVELGFEGVLVSLEDFLEPVEYWDEFFLGHRVIGVVGLLAFHIPLFCALVRMFSFLNVSGLMHGATIACASGCVRSWFLG